MPTCNRCKAPIVWITTPKGKHMPCDPPIVTAPTVDNKLFRIRGDGQVIQQAGVTLVTLHHGFQARVFL